MRQTGIIAALAVAAVVMATPSQAQDRKINVNIGGGEPTVRPDFWDLLD